MTDQQFEPGDVVRLRSGGPKMTVRDVHGDGSVRVEWFADAIAAHTFLPEMLEFISREA